MTEIHVCRSCHSARLESVFDLGQMPISDFIQPGSAVTYAPLHLVRCGNCSLVQLRDTVDRDQLFANYFYESGTNEMMVAALQDVADDAVERVTLNPGDIVLDIGANDGTLLRMFPDTATRIAVEPALNLYTQLQGGGPVVAGRYWPLVDPPRDLTQPAKIITSIACFYSCTDPDGFVAAIARNLAPEGVWINQLAYLPSTLATNNYGDICHEHLTYWTTAAFETLLDRHGLVVERATRNDVNGGSIRYVVKHRTAATFTEATEWDYLTVQDIRAFGERAKNHRLEMRKVLRAYKRQGKRVLGYGASTKGNTYLAWWGIDTSLLPAIADRNPRKVGLVTSTGIPIISEDAMRKEPPDALLILPWHFEAAFRQREADYLANGGSFLIPFPEPHVVTGADALPLAA